MRQLPTLLGAAVLGLCSAMLIFNMLAGTLAHANGNRFWQYELFGGLRGVTEPIAKQRLTLRSFLDGSFQAVYARSVGPHVPIFNFAVRLRNQVTFSLLDGSATPTIIVGAGDELIEHVYSDDYCGRDLAAFLPTASVWAAKIRAMQDTVQREGKTFLYVVTPSKVGQYPAFLPPSMPCPAALADRARLVPGWIALVRAAGVNVVDATEIITAAHGRYPFPLYPQGGTHWNAIGKALAGNAVAAALDRLRPQSNLVSRRFAWRVAAHPSNDDLDLAQLMNLLWLPETPPTPAVTLLPAAPPGPCAPLNVVIVGGSFAHAVGASLSQQPCRPHVVEYEYWHAYTLIWKLGKMTEIPFDPQLRSTDLQRADIVIYEDNEQMLGRSEHGEALYDYVMHAQ